ncbi:hypothetical protein J4E91_006177 [Alternaria rosae]|nr:hypothetical protein J4E91_006177 [Alternaria rosae]
MQRRMLTKDEEASAQSEDLEVRREDQEKINKFSSLHQKEELLEEELRAKIKEKEDLEEISGELELVDEEEKVPYKVGDCFVSLPQPQVLELLGSSTETIDSEVEALKAKLEGIQEEMGELKKALYGRFGRSINLETLIIKQCTEFHLESRASFYFEEPEEYDEPAEFKKSLYA